eukprot:COSAG06_NODE_728_length_12746_cov_13.586068_9_plen_118_part_00
MGRFAIEGGVQYLVRWKGFDDSDEDTWEPLDSLGSAQQAIERFENAKPNAKAAAAAIGTKAKPPREAPPPRVAGKKTHICCAILYLVLQMITLPRQARGKCRERTQKEIRFLQRASS